MSRQSYEPSKRDLSKAWTVKKNGGTKRDICKRLGITMGQYERHTQTFNSYFAQRRNIEKFRRDSRKPAKRAYKKPPNMRNGECKLTMDNVDLDVLRSYVVCGFNKDKIAGLLGVTRSTLYTFTKKHPKVQRIFDHSDEEVLADIYHNGLLKLCKEHELPDMIHASYRGKITTMNVKKKFNPSLNAIKYIFANKLGWSSEPTGKKSNNKGAILKMLDELANGDEDEEEKEES